MLELVTENTLSSKTQKTVAVCFSTTVLMAMGDATYNFIYGNVGCQGRISDGVVYRETSFYKKLAKEKLKLSHPEPLPGSNKLSSYVFLTDDAFPLKKHIMKSYTIIGIHTLGE